jgi:hypothetical protein
MVLVFLFFCCFQWVDLRCEVVENLVGWAYKNMGWDAFRED